MCQTKFKKDENYNNNISGEAISEGHEKYLSTDYAL